jgi:uncharacterized protein (UPF0332 family)
MKAKARNEVILLFEKADEDIGTVRLMIKGKYYWIAISRSYYAMLYFFNTLFLLQGIWPSLHGRIRELNRSDLAKLRNLDKKFLGYFQSAKEKQVRADEDLERFSKREAERQLKHVEELRTVVWSAFEACAKTTTTQFVNRKDRKCLGS